MNDFDYLERVPFEPTSKLDTTGFKSYKLTLAPDEESRLLQQLRAGWNLKIRNGLVVAYQPLVMAAARDVCQPTYHTLDRNDFVMEGNKRLIKVLDEQKPRETSSLDEWHSYLWKNVKGEMLSHFTTQMRHNLGMTRLEFKTRKPPRRMVSLDQPMASTSTRSINDLLISSDLGPEEEVSLIQNQKLLQTCYKGLSELERDILHRICDGELYSSVGASVGLSEGRIGQIYRKTTEKFSAALNGQFTRPDLTEEKIGQWLLLFHEKEGQWPSLRELNVWDKNMAGEWIAVKGEEWGAIDSALQSGTRGLPGNSSLAQFKQSHGYTDDFTKEKIIQWVYLFFEKEKRWPTASDNNVWSDGYDGQWQAVKGMNWKIIDLALRKNRKGLSENKTLLEFKKEHGLHGTSNAQLLRWATSFYKKEGRMPYSTDQIVWDQDKYGTWMRVPQKSWAQFSSDLIKGEIKGVSAGTTLKEWRRQNGLDAENIWNEAKIARWITLYREKEGRYPLINDKVVWDKDANGQWMMVKDNSAYGKSKDLHWRIIDRALTSRMGDRGLPGGSSLQTIICRMQGRTVFADNEAAHKTMALHTPCTSLVPVRVFKELAVRPASSSSLVF